MDVEGVLREYEGVVDVSSTNNTEAIYSVISLTEKAVLQGLDSNSTNLGEYISELAVGYGKLTDVQIDSDDYLAKVG